MGGTLEELQSEKPSNIGIPAFDHIKISTVAGETFSEAILLAGRKVVSLHSPDALTSTTNITLQGANFSSRTTTDANADYKNGFLIPEDADFDDLYDSTDTIVQITASDGEKIWAFPDFGFPMWVRLDLSVAQIADFYLCAKG